MYSNIVDEYKLYELILKYELLLNWIWISIFTEFAKRRFAWMKVSDELKMKLLHYSPVHCNGLTHPCGNCLYFPMLLWNEKNFFSKLTFYQKNYAWDSLGKNNNNLHFLFSEVFMSLWQGSWLSLSHAVAACLLLIWNLVVSWASPGKSRSMSDVLKPGCFIKADDWMWLSLSIVKGCFKINISC